MIWDDEMLKAIVKRTPFLRDVASIIMRIITAPRQQHFNSAAYWEKRYRSGGNSGPGSYSRLAEFKAEIINGFVREHEIASIIELGCGDGAQLSLAHYPNYIGVDVSPTVIRAAQQRFFNDETKRFVLSKDAEGLTAEVAVSLDVIYHLVEDGAFERYMRSLFATAQKYVIVYSSNDDRKSEALHVRHRRFTEWVDVNAPLYSLVRRIPNRFPHDKADRDSTSFADFYFFEKTKI